MLIVAALPQSVRETGDRMSNLAMAGVHPVVIDHPVSSITPAEIEIRVAQIKTQAQEVWLGRCNNT